MTTPFSRRDFLCSAPAAYTAAAVFGFGSVSAKAASGATPAKGNSAKSTISAFTALLIISSVRSLWPYELADDKYQTSSICDRLV